MDVRFEHPHDVVRTVTTTHLRVGVRPSCDPGLRYMLAVPRGWGQATEVRAPQMGGRANLLGVFSETADLAGPRVIVTATRMRWEVDPLAWVRDAWMHAGWSVAVAGWLDTPKGRFELGAMRHRDGQTEVRRTTGFVDNGRLLRVDVVTPADRWAPLHDLLWPCGPLMQLDAPTRSTQIEPRIEHVGRGWRTTVPASWSVHALPDPEPGVERWIATPADAVQRAVSIRIDVARRRDAVQFDAATRRLKNELADVELCVARRGTPLDVTDASEIAGLVAAVQYRVQRKDGEHLVLSTARIERGPLTIDYALIVASPKKCSIDRMRGHRAFELALHSTRIAETTEHHAT